MAKIAIIGAGVGGLSAGYDLAQHGHDVHIFEAGERVGGLAAGFKDPSWDWHLEKFYHHWFESDNDLLQLASEIGMREKVFFPRPKTSYWIDGKIYRSEISLSALLLPVSPIAKLRLAIGGAILKLSQNWQSFEKHTAHDWLLRIMGREVYETFFQPLLIGKFGADYRDVNMAWFWARIKSRTLRLGSYEGGFQSFLDDLGAATTRAGASIHLQTPVQCVTAQPELTDQQRALSVETQNQQQAFDAVLSTTSPRLLQKIVPQIEGEYALQLQQLRSIGAVVVVYALKHQLLKDGTYWLNLPASSADKSQNRFPFLALVEHTNYLDKAHYNNDHLVYAGDYVAPDHDYFQLSEEELVQRFMLSFPTFNRNFSPDWVRETWVFRAPYAQPVPPINHSEAIPDIRTPVAGVYWASMSQVYPWDRGTNYAVEIGRRAAKMMLEDLP
jgi:protoporphyrinogen oxidase